MTTPQPSPRRCRACGDDIPSARLIAMPDTPWCRACAETRVPRVGGNLVWTHKTAPDLEIKPLAAARQFEAQRARHAYNASIRVDGITAAMDRMAGVPPWEE